MTATGLERRLRAAAGAGEWLDLADDPDREMDAGLLRALLVGDAPIAGGDPVPPRAVRVRGARIAGSLELEGRRLVCSLHLADCEAESPIVLREATAPAIRLHGCAIASLSAAELQTRGNLELDRCRIGGELNLMRAHIAGQLSLTGAQLAGHAGVALNADGLRVGGGMICRRVSAKGEVRLLDAHVTGVLTLAGAELAHEGAAALGADRLQVDGDMFCEALGADRFMANGEIRLLGAHIGGQLSLAGADLANTGGTALHADGIRVDDGIFAEPEGSHRFTVEGEIRLLGAHVGGELSFSGAQLTNPDGRAINADGIRVEGGMRLERIHAQRFSAKGEIRLINAHITGSLSLTGAELLNEGGWALIADFLEVDGSVFCRAQAGAPFTSKGEVRLLGAHVTRQVGFEGAELDGGDALALDLEGASVDGELFMRFATPTVGGIDLTAARLGRVFDSEATWPDTLRLRGCGYSRIAAVEDASERPGPGASWPARVWWHVRPGGTPDVQRRLRWIRLAEAGPGGASGGYGYAQQPYTELMAYYRREGRDADARRVGFERERRRRGQLRIAGQLWNLFLRFTVGYGYKPLRAVVLLAVLVCVGARVFSSLHTDGQIPAIRHPHPPFVALIYTLDRLIPVVSFGLRDAFGPRGSAQWWAFGYTLLGWMLTVAVLAGVNAAVRRD